MKWGFWRTAVIIPKSVRNTALEPNIVKNEILWILWILWKMKYCEYCEYCGRWNIVNIVNIGEDGKLVFWRNKKWRSVLGGKMRLPWELSSSKFKFVLPLSELTVTLDSPWHSLQHFLSLHCKCKLPHCSHEYAIISTM